MSIFETEKPVCKLAVFNPFQLGTSFLQNLEPSCGICPFPWNLYVFA